MKEKITVLIADDNQEFSQTLASYIDAQEDMEVIAKAKDGTEVIDIIANTVPDVILLDVIMPHLDGLGVLENINKIKIAKKPICIMLSAVGQDKITQRAIELGAQYYVVKPFDIESLISSVRRTNCILTVEEHSILGGLGGTVAEILGREYPVLMDNVGIADTFTETGGYDELLRKYQISVDTIIEKTRRLFGCKANK